MLNKSISLNYSSWKVSSETLISSFVGSFVKRMSIYQDALATVMDYEIPSLEKNYVLQSDVVGVLSDDNKESVNFSV